MQGRGLLVWVVMLAAGRAAAQAPASQPAVPLSLPEPYFARGPAQQAAADLALERWQAARDGFAAVLAGKNAPENSDTRARLSFLVAWCDARLGRWADAAAGFDQTGAALPLLAEYAAYWAATAYVNLGDWAHAKDRIARVPAGSVLAAEAQLLLGDVLRGQSDWKAEAKLYDGYLKDHPGGIRVAEARFRLAEAEEKLGRRLPDALLHYRQVGIDSPLSSWAGQAKVRFDALLATVDKKKRSRYTTFTAAELVTRGKEYFEAMRNELAEADFTAALKAKPLDKELRCVAAYHLAQTVFKERQRTRSAPLFDDAVAACEQSKNADLQTRSAYQGGRAWSTAHDYQKAIALFEKAETWHPDHSFADDSRLRQAETWDSLGELQNTPEAFDAKISELLSTLPDKYPDGDMKGEALWRLAWRAYKAARYEEAIQWLGKEAAAVGHEENYWAEGQTSYWTARADEKLGRGKEAEAAYLQTVREYPLSYYSLLALNRLREASPAAFKEVSEELKRPPAEWAPGTPAFQFAARPVYGDPHFERGVELLRLGLGGEAERELTRAGLKVPPGKKKVADPDRAEQLWATALLYDRAGRYDQSHWIARWSVLDYKRAWPTEANRARWEIAYPRAWWHLLEPAAHQQGYPPDLLIAFVREESAFDPIMESFANAIGLTQMIFPTAQRFGKGLGFAITRENLRDPEKNVAIGSRFLAFLWKTFNQDVGLVVPAYNAGEGAVWGWLCARGSWSLDEFGEEIPYDETRNYTKRVLSSYFAYSYLTDGTIPVVPNAIPPAVINEKVCARKR